MPVLLLDLTDHVMTPPTMPYSFWCLGLPAIPGASPKHQNQAAEAARSCSHLVSPAHQDATAALMATLQQECV